jgi:hypothetical protein
MMATFGEGYQVVSKGPHAGKAMLLTISTSTGTSRRVSHGMMTLTRVSMSQG